MNKFILVLTALVIQLLFFPLTFAGPTKVGNGDDGQDLEGFEKLESGPIVEARAKAVEHLKSLNSPAIKHLGSLLPEVEKADLYITKKDISTKQLLEMGAFTNDAKGLVYARTFPTPHAPTRFFPAARNLSQDQLITLHIHEALHRALPLQIRENEQAVSEVALAITSPGATRDRIEQKINSFMPSSVTAPMVQNQSHKKLFVPDTARVKSPSTFALAYRKFSLPDSNTQENVFITKPLTGMYELKSHLYPFGANDTALGIGIDLAFLQTAEDNQMGPLGLSGRWLAYTHRGFDFEFFADISLNTLSDAELKNSLLGRDVYTLGLNISKKGEYFYISNDISLTTSGEVSEKIGNIDYNYEFGNITGIKINAGVRFKNLHLGGFAELLLSDNFKVSGGAMSGEEAYETGRNRVFSVGPQVSWQQKSMALDIYGRFLLDSSKDMDYEFLGNIMEQGVGQGYIGSTIKLFF